MAPFLNRVNILKSFCSFKEIISGFVILRSLALNYPIKYMTKIFSKCLASPEALCEALCSLSNKGFSTPCKSYKTDEYFYLLKEIKF